jgi:phospholipid/cholesterol/gamma-HCH transport system permease protein
MSAFAAPRVLFAVRQTLAWVGHSVRRPLRFGLPLMALALGIVMEALIPRSWRRPARLELWRALRLALVGSLPATMVVAVLAGLGMVYQALYWLRVAGQEASIGSILVAILFREVVPLLVGIILLGRSGSAMLTELGQMQTERQLRALQAQGVDPFQFLAMPRGTAFALASYTLGIVFILVALMVGFALASLLGVVQVSLWSFLDGVLGATTPADFIVLPLKMIVIGLLIGASGCLTAWSAPADEDLGRLIARGFIRGMVIILLTSGLLSLAI